MEKIIAILFHSYFRQPATGFRRGKTAFFAVKKAILHQDGPFLIELHLVQFGVEPTQGQ